MLLVVGQIIKQSKSCACGETKEGYCNNCKTTALDVVIFESVESIREGQYDAKNEVFMLPTEEKV